MTRRRALPGREPFELFLLVLTFIVHIPIVLFDSVPPSSSVTSATDPQVAYVWAVIMLIGSAVSLIGIAWPIPRHPDRISVTGHALEQIGLVTVGVACLFYAAAIIVAGNTPKPIQAMSIVLAYGSACLWQAHRIQSMFRKLGRRVGGRP
jgi:hypothetical protein